MKSKTGSRAKYHKKYMKKYRKKNRENIRVYQKQYDFKRREELKERNRKYRLVHKEKIKIYRDAYRKKNKEYFKQYAFKNKEKLKKKRKLHTIKVKYNLLPEQYEKLFSKQKHKCGICKRALFPYDRLANIDHDHGTGRIRGILCVPCNFLLGLAHDNKKWLRNAIRYLG